MGLLSKLAAFPRPSRFQVVLGGSLAVYVYIFCALAAANVTLVDSALLVLTTFTIIGGCMCIAQLFGKSPWARVERTVLRAVRGRVVATRVGVFLTLTLSMWTLVPVLPIIGGVVLALGFFVLLSILEVTENESAEFALFAVGSLLAIFALAYLGPSLLGTPLDLMIVPTQAAHGLLAKLPVLGDIVPVLDADLFRSRFLSVMDPLTLQPDEIPDGSGWFENAMTFVMRYLSPVLVIPRAAIGAGLLLFLAIQGLWWFCLYRLLDLALRLFLSAPYLVAIAVRRYGFASVRSQQPLGLGTLMLALWGAIAVPAACMTFYSILFR